MPFLLVKVMGRVNCDYAPVESAGVYIVASYCDTDYGIAAQVRSLYYVCASL